MDASNLLKPALSRGRLRCIGATTMEEYRKRFERDNALLRRFLTNLVPQRFDVEVMGQKVATVRQNFNPFVLELLVDFSAFNGLMHENMTRNYGWSFLEMGRRLERGYNLGEAILSLFVLSTTHLALLVDLDRVDVLTGVASRDAVIGPELETRIKTAKLVEFAKAGLVIDVERVVARLVGEA